VYAYVSVAVDDALNERYPSVHGARMRKRETSEPAPDIAARTRIADRDARVSIRTPGTRA